MLDTYPNYPGISIVSARAEPSSGQSPVRRYRAREEPVDRPPSRKLNTVEVLGPISCFMESAGVMGLVRF